MAASSVYLISSLVIVLIACQTCSSIECTNENLDACDERESEVDCPHYRHSSECLKKIDTCVDDQLQGFVTSTIDFFDRIIADCPGIPDGKCYHTLINNCLKGTPYDVIHKVISDDEKKELCDKHKGIAKDTKNCVEAIRPQCTKISPQQNDISQAIKGLELIEQACGFDSGKQ